MIIGRIINIVLILIPIFTELIIILLIQLSNRPSFKKAITCSSHFIFSLTFSNQRWRIVIVLLTGCLIVKLLLNNQSFIKICCCCCSISLIFDICIITSCIIITIIYNLIKKLLPLIFLRDISVGRMLSNSLKIHYLTQLSVMKITVRVSY